MTDSLDSLCNASLHPQAADGLRLFNAGKYFEAHEALEEAWNEEKGKSATCIEGFYRSPWSICTSHEKTIMVRSKSMSGAEMAEGLAHDLPGN